MKESHDLQIGDGVFLDWFEYPNGEKIGGVLVHPKADNPRGYCEGSFWFDLPINGKKTTWGFNGDFEKPTLTPSFLCHCGYHGFVQEGKWVNA